MQKEENLFKIQHIPRDCNVMAHALAKIVVANGDTCIWQDSFAPQVLSIITQLI